VGITGRGALIAAILVAVAIAIAVPARQLVDQRAEIANATAANERTEERISLLEEAVTRWSDPAFIAAQARQRLRFVFPGETAFIVIGPDGQAVEPENVGPVSTFPTLPQQPSAWYERLWASFERAAE
jgi:cell division protein FtsB